MGRTLPTSTMLIQEFEESWRPYARALRKQDREILNDLFAMVRFQSAAIAFASRPDPFQAFMLAMLGGILRRVIHLENALEALAFSTERESVENPSDLGPRARATTTRDHALACPLAGGFQAADQDWPTDGHPSARDWPGELAPLLPAFAESVSGEMEAR